MKKLNGSGKILIIVAIAVAIFGLVTEIVTRTQDADNELGFTVSMEEAVEVDSSELIVMGEVDKDLDSCAISYVVTSADDESSIGDQGGAVITDGKWEADLILPFAKNVVTFTASTADGKTAQKVIEITVAE